MSRRIWQIVDYTATIGAGAALWAFTITGWPVFIRAFRTSTPDCYAEPEIIG